MKRAIITGATGAIGTALIKELINKNVEILVFTRKDSKRNNNIPNNSLITIKYASLKDISSVKNENKIEYDVFFHLAWAGAFGEGRNDINLQKENVECAIDAVECAKRFGCKKFIGIGSQAEYGLVNEPLKSTTSTNPESEYGKAKLEAGYKTMKRAKELGLKFNWVRILSVYGPNDGNKTLISYAVEKMKNNEDLNVTKCEQIWDYLYSDDAANAIIAIAEKGVDTKTYVFGSGKHIKLMEYLETIKKILNSKSVINYGANPYSPKQVMYLCADNDEIKKDTGWEPKVSFEDGIKSII